MRYGIIVIIIFILSGLCVNAQKIHVSSDFPGGNIVVNKIAGDTVWLKPDLSFTKGEWFYWYFKISNIAGKKVTFKFDQDDIFARYGPGYSINNNYTWKWYGENRIINNSFSYSFSEKDTIAYFSVAFPYVEDNLTDFLGSLRNHKLLKLDTLCYSRENRVVEKISIPSTNRIPTFKVLITARHHATEMMADYVIEGIVNSLLNDRNLNYLREHVEFMVIPFMDKDGVENGEQGKNRIPRDHNRDYDGESIYNSTAALRDLIPDWSDNKLKVAIDIHCPRVIGGIYEESIYNVGVPNYKIGQNQIFFSQLLEKNSLGELKLYHKNFLPYGKDWNTGNVFSEGTTFATWASALEGISLATTIEFPYSNVSGIFVTKDNSRIFGQAIAHSIQDYLESLEKE